MIIELREPSSGNLMTLSGSFQKRTKTYHNLNYIEKSNSIQICYSDGMYIRRSYERTI